MATAKTSVTEGSGVNIATYSFTEDTITKQIQRVVVGNADGSDVDQTATVNVAQDTAVLKNGATSLTPKFASVGGVGSTDLVALVSGKKIRVLSYVLVFNAASTAKFQTGATTDLTGAMPFGANGGVSASHSPVGHFETAAGAKLNLVLGASVAWAGHITYVEV